MTSPSFAWDWNVPLKAINPYALAKPARRPSALAVWIALYEQDKSDQREQAEAMSRAAEEYLFSVAHCDPWRYDELNDALIEKAKRHAELHRVDPLTLIRDDVASLPGFLRKPLESRIKYLEKSEDPRHLPTYLNEVITPSLVRIDKVRANQASLSFQAMAGRDSLDQLLRLAELNQREIKRLSTLVAAHIDMIFIQLCDEMLTDELASPIVILELYRRVAAEVSRLDVIPPGYEALRSKHNRRNPINYELIPGALARMRCADWWQRKLWQLRNEWREELLRAACLVHRHASPYVSHDILLQKREQRRKAMDFFRNHDLINEDGDTLSMEDVVLASASNPAHRRNEMMACVKGLELIAEMRGDCAMFYTITCPSKYHATLMNGKPNPTWDHSTVRKSSDYLVDTFAAFRKAMHKKELRWYGVRVAEPHHDGTVHWHLLCFMRKKHRRAITELLRRFAIREDRAELGNNTGARFKSKLIDPRKGTPASYIAKYVSKNIDGRGLGDTVSKETGKSLRDSAEHVTAWASLHRVQQFRFFGIPGRQAYRELRLFASQATRAMKTSKPGAPVLMDPKLDAVLAAADVGCFATYIMKQGGVLVPRKNYLIHTAYEPTVEPGTYGDHGIRIYGIWSPMTGKENKICTHAHTWKMVKKAPANPGAESAAQGDPVAPWTRGNNCPQSSKGLEKVIVNDAEISEQLVHDEELGSLDVSSLPAKERNAVLRYLREACKVKALPVNKPQLLNSSPRACSIRDFALSIGIELSESQIEHLMQGKRLRFYDRIFYATLDGELRSTEPENSDIQIRNVWRTLKKHNKVELSKIVRDPIGNYMDMLRKIDPDTWVILLAKNEGKK
ncbi:TPA: replication endonuclease [Klebsiella pneumoniae]|uniref:Replication associated protein n=1 Tax=Myoviridae sp. ct2iG11 TaxID=2826605 RepID=A0A8S5QZN8_9CAUD|nr:MULTISPECIES: replication endonuclease [Klebsiella]DAE24727.1 MAG TPA: Replication associated protein [Myoviridae sp. ct2iG11]EIX9510427.1 replication endonuclease [Klebsiella pneumoniae]EKZ5840897.1 replication endonuclease [Klebsiella pneumoniae]ELA3325152.1 replication endonuclease [Klebsiella pneumoniae]KAB0310614.1 replication endonuclease [Klebsiella pneumoniae]